MNKEEFILVVIKDMDGKEIKRLAVTKEEVSVIADVLPKLSKLKIAKTEKDTKEYIFETNTQLYDIKTLYRKSAENIDYIEVQPIDKIKKDK